MTMTRQNKEDKKAVIISGLLFLVPLVAVSFSLFDGRYQFPFLGYGEHFAIIELDPIDPVSKRAAFVASLAGDRVASIIYLVVIRMSAGVSKILRVNPLDLFISYEIARLLDLLLTYEQTPFRGVFGIFLISVFMLSSIKTVYKNAIKTALNTL